MTILLAKKVLVDGWLSEKNLHGDGFAHRKVREELPLKVNKLSRCEKVVPTVIPQSIVALSHERHFGRSATRKN